MDRLVTYRPRAAFELFRSHALKPSPLRLLYASARQPPFIKLAREG